ncbi:alpha-hydroxy acid oxidase [Aeromicrobium alkaliterrae]|uniref:Alpha-hydroxy acid oxidase n=1 Tax=Aeromicrobium alkaliterrae TaxID=302168 RepID=A0ABN2K4N6_9ACTN
MSEQREGQRDASDYREGGAGDVPAENERQWQAWALQPRTLVGPRAVDLTTTVHGLELALPVLAAPSAWHGLWHPEAEAETARGVVASGCGLVLSHGSTLPPEEVATAPYLQQLYLSEDRELVLPFVERARAAGAVALVLTVDQLPVPRQQAFRLAASEVPAPRWSAYDTTLAGSVPARGFGPEDVAWLATATSLPVVVKGVLHPDDAVAAVDAGAAGVVVSNHGGRQLAGSITTAEVLPEVVAAVAGRVPVHVDSGIRDATDVVRALALGADSVWLGRPVLRALEAGGADAVAALLRELRDDLAGLLALLGVDTPADLHPGLVRRRVA